MRITKSSDSTFGAIVHETSGVEAHTEDTYAGGTAREWYEAYRNTVQASTEEHDILKERFKDLSIALEVTDRNLEEASQRIQELEQQLEEAQQEFTVKLPEDLSWPEFEDGTPVTLGDEFCTDAKMHHNVAAKFIAFSPAGLVLADDVSWVHGQFFEYKEAIPKPIHPTLAEIEEALEKMEDGPVKEFLTDAWIDTTIGWDDPNAEEADGVQ